MTLTEIGKLPPAEVRRIFGRISALPWPQQLDHLQALSPGISNGEVKWIINFAWLVSEADDLSNFALIYPAALMLIAKYKLFWFK